MNHYLEWIPIFRLLIIVALSFGSNALMLGQDIDRTNPNFILSHLQVAFKKDGSALVKQDELDCLIREGGGGACPSATGIIVETNRNLALTQLAASSGAIFLSGLGDVDRDRFSLRGRFLFSRPLDGSSRR